MNLHHLLQKDHLPHSFIHFLANISLYVYLVRNCQIDYLELSCYRLKIGFIMLGIPSKLSFRKFSAIWS